MNCAADSGPIHSIGGPTDSSEATEDSQSTLLKGLIGNLSSTGYLDVTDEELAAALVVARRLLSGGRSYGSPRPLGGVRLRLLNKYHSLQNIHRLAQTNYRTLVAHQSFSICFSSLRNVSQREQRLKNAAVPASLQPIDTGWGGVLCRLLLGVMSLQSSHV